MTIINILIVLDPTSYKEVVKDEVLQAMMKEISLL